LPCRESVAVAGPRRAPKAPAIIADVDEVTLERFAEFFAANFQNPKTRPAHFRNAVEFF